ncbi:chemotaxis protein CheR [Actinoplanes sp. SE50]|uniref:CheR family methyltransferase n=1 Tax=unclassified Actinoplanes TaxID=2626549 RepID=UPI00023ECD1E|nr:MULTISPECIES: CheR family methyltransferase [unclassified Actinoplanes]AEV86024.1 chemotaxis protein methyltransferase CheR [Actinoplanes sp. SE50/110]ATO84422.1 chemotaxis protein CheR [Actinoplanes sp. SE50]SLM01832.1 chemotaxis protein CheR [Actinoplanes sp. SE50/110]
MSGEPPLVRFREILERRLGWAAADTEAVPVLPVLAERAAARQLTESAYLDRLAGRAWPEETVILAERLSITETYFFRHGDQFRALASRVLPQRIEARAGQRVLRMLSVGCSSGEEAYSLAIVAHRVRPAPDWIVAVLGVDANPEVLRRARRAVYSEWSLRETPPDVRSRWFRSVPDGYEVAREITGSVQFVEHNVAGPEDPRIWQPGRYDAVFCRNLLMYLTPATVRGVLDRITGSLADGGALFLGHTDSLGSAPPGFTVEHHGDTVFYRRSIAAPTPQPAPRAAPPRVAPPPRVRSPRTPEIRSRALDLLRDERFAEALDLLAPVSSQHPLLYGVLLAQLGRLPEAAAVATRLIDAGAPQPDAHQLLGLCREIDEPDQAAAQYRLAAYLDPGFAMPRLRLGLLARREGDETAAAAELTAALDLLPRESEERITLFGGGFGRLTLSVLCRAERDGARR